MSEEVKRSGDYVPKNDALYGVAAGMAGALVAAPFLGPLYCTQRGLAIQKMGIHQYLSVPSRRQVYFVMGYESIKYGMSFYVADSIQNQFAQSGIFKNEQICNVVSKFSSGFFLAPITSILSTIQVKAFTDPNFSAQTIVKMFQSYQSVNGYIKGTGLIPNMFLQGINLSVLFGVGPYIRHSLHQSNICQSELHKDIAYLFSGLMASQISILLGSPFARIATMQRTMPADERSGMLSLVKQIMQKEGARGFVKGSGSATAMIHATNTARTFAFWWLTESSRNKGQFFSSKLKCSSEDIPLPDFHECPFSNIKP